MNNNNTNNANNNSNLFKVLKKSQIDTTSGGGFSITNNLHSMNQHNTQNNLNSNLTNQQQNNTQIRTHSRNQINSSGLGGNGVNSFGVGLGQGGLNNTLTGPLQYDNGSSLTGYNGTGNYSLDIMMNGSSPNVINKKSQSYSRNKNAHNTANNKQYFTQNLTGIKELTRAEMDKQNSKQGNGTNGGGYIGSSVNRQNSNRRMNQQQQQQLTSKNHQINSGQNSIQVQNLTQLLKEQQIINSNSLPPMTTTNKQQQSFNSRNMTYKSSLSDNLAGKVIKGISPKANHQLTDHQQQQQQQFSLTNYSQSPNKNHRANSQVQQSATKTHTQGISNLMANSQIDNFKGSQSLESNQIKSAKAARLMGENQAAAASRTRNNAQSLGRQGDLTGNNKPQFYTMKNQSSGGASLNMAQSMNGTNMIQQSPHNYSTRFNHQAALRGLQQQNQQPPAAQTSAQNNFGLDFDPTIGFVQSYDPAKFATKRNGVVVSYAANTHQGIIRNYNEDRVSIILNIIQPKFKETKNWPRCSFFGVYDGHGGAACADYLRDQLHQMIVKDTNFPQNPKKAIENAFTEAEKKFMEFADVQAVIETGQIDRSGSCAIIVLIVGDICYVANVGDSRAIMSVDGGEKILLLSKDHKPESEDETLRIEENGGRIYQNSNYIPDMSPQGKGQMQLIVGPHRVFPGRLSVSRTFGDIEAKEVKYGGNPKVVIPTPDIKCFKIKNNYDFIVIACDGVFEKLNNTDVVQAVWQASKKQQSGSQSQPQDDSRTIHEKCGHSVDRILHTSAFRRTFDNITAVMIAFENFENIAGQSLTANQANNNQNSNHQPQIYQMEQDKHNYTNNLETVIEEEYLQSEELELNNLGVGSAPTGNTYPQIDNKEQRNSSAKNNQDQQYLKQQKQQERIQNAQNNNESKEDYQFDINSQESNSKSQNSNQNSKTNNQNYSQNQQQPLNQIVRRQSASSPLHQQRTKTPTSNSALQQSQQYQSNSLSQILQGNNVSSFIGASGGNIAATNSNNGNGQNAQRMSFQANSRLSNTNLGQQQQHQTLTNSKASNSEDQQQQQLLKDRLTDQLFGSKSNPTTGQGARTSGSQTSKDYQKSSSLGRREDSSKSRNEGSSNHIDNRLVRNSNNSGLSGGVTAQGNPVNPIVMEKGYSSSSRVDSRNLKNGLQNLPLTQSLVGGLAPFAQSYVDQQANLKTSMTTQGIPSSQNRPAHSRNSQIKQYSSLGAPIANQTASTPFNQHQYASNNVAGGLSGLIVGNSLHNSNNNVGSSGQNQHISFNNQSSIPIHQQDLDQFSRTQLLSSKQQNSSSNYNSVGNTAANKFNQSNSGSKNWMSNTQQLSGISQMAKGGKNERQNSRGGKHSLL